MVNRHQREARLGQRAVLFWFTGLPGAGKTTLAITLEAALFDQGYQTVLLDGDILRKGLTADLAFADADRTENIRRAAEVSRLFLEAGIIVIAAFVSPFQSDREKAKAIVGNENFVEIFLDCPLTVCEERDPKGHYVKARAGEIKNFTGIGSPYERPTHPDLVLRTDWNSVEESLEQLLDFALPRVKKT